MEIATTTRVKPGQEGVGLLQGDWRERLAYIDTMMREMSRQDDPQAMVRSYVGRIRKRGHIGFPVHFYEQDPSHLAVRVGQRKVDVHAARDAADHLARAVRAAHDHLGILREEEPGRATEA